MTDRFHTFVYGRGETQASRRDAELLPDYAQVDERGLPELLAYLTEFAKLVGFVDAQGEFDGDWTRFLGNDESFLLAQACASTVESVASSLPPPVKDHANGADGAYGVAAVAEPAALVQIFSITRRIDAWYKRAAQIDTGSVEAHPFASNLKHVITNDLRRYVMKIQADRTLGRVWSRLLARANLTLAPVWLGELNRSVSFDPDDLTPVVTAFERVLDQLTKLARRYLESSQHESADHAPHAGLLIAFVKLLGVVKGELNDFTGRHLHYYLHDVLRFKPRPSQPDSTLAAFALAPRAASLLLAQGTRLSAGADAAGVPIVFESAAPLVVTQAKINSLMALRAVYADDDMTPGTPADADVGPLPLDSIVAYRVADSADGAGTKLAKPALGWPTFGPDRDTAINAGNPAPDAEVGFAIASPLLLLTGGDRTITLSFSLGERKTDAAGAGAGAGNVASGVGAGAGSTATSAPPSPIADDPQEQNVYARLDRLAVHYERELASRALTPLPGTTAPPAPRPPLSPQAFLHGMLADTCSVSLSCKEGWFAVQRARLSVNAGSLDLVIELPADAPAVVANPVLAFDQDGAPLPMLRVLMNPDARVYGYSFFDVLRETQSTRATLAVSVRGMTALDVQNSLGPLQPGKPMMPFGPAPIIGSFLQIGSPELACKAVSYFGVQIDWLNLPAGGGFAAYYQGYPPDPTGAPLTRDSFVVGIDRHDGADWQPVRADRPSRYQLFAPASDASAAAAGQSAAVTRFDIDSAYGPAATTFSGAFTPGSQAGALRIALTEPAGAFGYHAYSRALADAVMKNSRIERDKPALVPVPIPNPPFVPMASRIALDYDARAAIDFASLDMQSTLRFDTIAPFGHVRARNGWNTRFLPPAVRGALFVGLSGVAAGDTLTLLFQLADRYAPQTVDFALGERRRTGSGLTWHFLADNQWKSFDQQDVLDDSTFGLTCSGIVKLVLPSRLDLGSTLMPAGQFWLAAMVTEGDEPVCDTIAIVPNAVAVQRVSNGEAVIANLPPQSIAGLVTKLPAIKAVLQPLPTWGGGPAETPQAFAARVAERLRHKQRAIQPYDYERLVLSSFAEIAQAKCIGQGNSRGYAGSAALPAGVVVVAVAARGADHETYVAQNTLRDARETLRPYVSPFLRRLTVRNPSFERLKVVAIVRLKTATSGAYYLSRLSAQLDDAIAPWRKQKDGVLPIGYGAIDGNSIASFIRQSEYVEALDDFRMEVYYNVSADGAGNDWTSTWYKQQDIVRPSTPWSVLTPHGEHLLMLAGSTSDGEPAKPAPDLPDAGSDPVRDTISAGIGSVVIGEDFITAPSVPEPAPTPTPAPAPVASEPLTMAFASNQRRVYYAKFLDSTIRLERRRQASGEHAEHDETAERVALLQDAFIDFPEPDARDAAGAPPDLSDA